jgi:hypothetical protein
MGGAAKQLAPLGGSKSRRRGGARARRPVGVRALVCARAATWIVFRSIHTQDRFGGDGWCCLSLALSPWLSLPLAVARGRSRGRSLGGTHAVVSPWHSWGGVSPWRSCGGVSPWHSWGGGISVALMGGSLGGAHGGGLSVALRGVSRSCSLLSQSLKGACPIGAGPRAAGARSRSLALALALAGRARAAGRAQQGRARPRRGPGGLSDNGGRRRGRRRRASACAGLPKQGGSTQVEGERKAKLLRPSARPQRGAARRGGSAQLRARRRRGPGGGRARASRDGKRVQR